MNSKMRKIVAGVAGATAALVLAAAPLTANAAERPEPVIAAASTAITQSKMEIDCSTFSEADRQKAIAENLNICGSLGATARGVVNADCGTSTFYVDRSSTGKLRISYGLFSSKGTIVTRSLTSTWGPALVGDNYDFGAVGRDTYSNTFEKGNLPRPSQIGGTLRGTVTIAGWTFSCNIVNDVAVRRI